MNLSIIINYISDLMSLLSEGKSSSESSEIGSIFEEDIDTNDLIKDLLDGKILKELIFEHMASQMEKDTGISLSSPENMKEDIVDHDFPISSTTEYTSEKKAHIDYGLNEDRMDNPSNKEFERTMNLRKRQQKCVKKFYSCEICKAFKGSMKKQLKEHITNVHRPITLEEYKSVFDVGESNIIKRWRKNHSTRSSEKRAIRMLMGKIRSYSTILSDELRKMEMTARDITPVLKLAFQQEVIPIDSLSRLLKIYASIV